MRKTILIVCLFLVAFGGTAAAEVTAVRSPTGKIVAYKDTSTGYMWWWIQDWVNWSTAGNRCSSYNAEGWYVGWSLPSVEQVTKFISDGGLSATGSNGSQIWTNETAYIAPFENVPEKFDYARCVSAKGGGVAVYWSRLIWEGSIFCIKQ
jgi:hypothetical protein